MSTTLAEIEKAYYKAIEATTISELKECDTAHGSLLYPKEAFLKWARKIDIHDLDKYTADFSLDEETQHWFENYRRYVENELRKNFQYSFPSSCSGINIKGTLKNIGSCHDGTKVEKMDEVDSFYVLEGDNITVESAGRRGFYRIYWQEGPTNFEIQARSMRHQFADACDRIVSKPIHSHIHDIRHGGYNSPQHSGLRYNGPAATSQFLVKDSLLTWDVTPTFPLPRDENIYRQVTPDLAKIRSVINRVFDVPDMHLIPDGSENLWRLSTAHLEAEMLRLLPRVAPLMQALCYCKILLSKLKRWNAQNCEGFTSEMNALFLGVMKELKEYVESSSKSKHIAQRLNKELRYAHIWIPHEKRKTYHEDQKSYISINNAAVKYILLSAALKQLEAFSKTENPDLVVELMQHVFKVLGDTSLVSSPHTFLGIDVPHLSILASQETHKVAAGLLIKEQCRTLALETMTVVGARSNRMTQYQLYCQ